MGESVSAGILFKGVPTRTPNLFCCKLSRYRHNHKNYFNTTEGLGKARISHLQIDTQQCQARSSVGEHYLDTVGVVGSIPSAPIGFIHLRESDLFKSIKKNHLKKKKKTK